MQALLVNEKKAAELLGVTHWFLKKRRVEGGGPKFVRVSSRCIRYRVRDLEEWAADRVRRHTWDHGDNTD